MTLRFTTSRVIGAAIALTIGTAATAAAQTTGTTGTTDSTRRDSTMGGMHGQHHGAAATTTTTSTGTLSRGTSGSAATRSRVRKDGGYEPATMGSQMETQAPAPAPMTPAPAPEPVPAPTPTPAPTATIEPAPAPAPVEAAPIPGDRRTRFGNGVYLGLGAGANFPQNNINNVYDAGFNAGAQLGWDPVSAPIGVRLNVTYNKLNGRRDVLTTSPTGTRTEQDLPDADLWSAFADTKVRLPFGRFLGATSGLYGLGGVGLTQFRNYQSFQGQTGTTTGGSVVNFDENGGRNVTRFAINGGGGISWGLGAVSLFAEGRYVRVFTQGRDTDYVPVTIGLSFH